MKHHVVVLAVVAGFTAVAQADTYRWVDDKGIIHFTDNPDRIPAKYLKRVLEIPSPEAPAPTHEGKAPEPVPQRQPQTATQGSSSELPGGLSEQAWRSRFSALRAELKTLKEELPVKMEALDQFRRKRTIYQRPQDRTAYNQQMDKIERDEARISELEAQLTALDIEASRAGVPLGWRQ